MVYPRVRKTQMNLKPSKATAAGATSGDFVDLDIRKNRA
jgi:hypothetical protein